MYKRQGLLHGAAFSLISQEVTGIPVPQGHNGPIHTLTFFLSLRLAGRQASRSPSAITWYQWDSSRVWTKPAD